MSHLSTSSSSPPSSIYAHASSSSVVSSTFPQITVQDPDKRSKRRAMRVASVEANGVTRAAQQKVVEGIKVKLGDRGITVDNALSKQGLRTILGHSPELGRLAEEYQKAKAQMLPQMDSQRAQLLEKLEAALLEIQSTESSNRPGLSHLIEFLKLEMTYLPETPRLFVEEPELKIEPLSQPLPTQKVEEPGMKGFSAEFLSPQNWKSMADDVANALRKKDAGKLHVCAEKLGSALAEELGRQSPEGQLGCVTSDGKALQKNLFQVLAGQLHDSKPFSEDYARPDSRLKKFLEAVYTHAVTRLPDHQVDTKTLVLGGSTYTEVKSLAKGGFGQVFLYKGVKDGDTRHIVVKAPLLDDADAQAKAEAFDNAAREARSHWVASQGGHPNVIGFVGAVRALDGTILLAMEYAENGDLSAFGKHLFEAERAGTISAKSAMLVRTALFQDMIRGLQHVQEVHGMTHLDIKPMNYFLSADGTAKLGDFGLADTSLTREFVSNPVGNPRYQAPEQISGAKETEEINVGELKALRTRVAIFRTKSNAEVMELAEPDREVFESLVRENIRGLNQLIKEYQNPGTTFQINEKADIWSLGVAAYELFFGERPFEGTWQREIENRIMQFGSDLASRIRPDGTDEPTSSDSRGQSPLDRLLNLAMHPEPSQRPGLGDLQRRSLFLDLQQQPQDLVRRLIQLLANPNPSVNDIKAAVQVLDAIMPESHDK